ncbi:DTX2 ligase, partial [Polypterus senegalus]
MDSTEDITYFRERIEDLSEEITMLAALLDSNIDETVFEIIEEQVEWTRLHYSISGLHGCGNLQSFLYTLAACLSVMAVAPTTAAVPPQPLVAVWQWQDDMGRWRPYNGKVSVFIEQSMQQRNGGLSSSNSSISLGLCDTSLASYIIDVPSLKQFRQDTGKMRSVCRILYSQSGAPGKGVTWEWANDEGGYTTYEMDICIFLEDSFNQHLTVVDLYTFGYDYTIDLTQNVQINKFSGFKRPIVRRVSVPPGGPWLQLRNHAGLEQRDTASAESAASSTVQEGTFELSELKVLLADLRQDIKKSEKANEKATAKAHERLKQEMKQANECLRQEIQQANERLRQEVQLELRQVLGKIEERIEKNSLN